MSREPRVVYVVLTSGREIIAELVSEDQAGLVLNEPLALESRLDEDDPSRCLVFMSRFSPYTDGPGVAIRRDAVATVSTASQLVTSYYRASLKYCVKFGDEKFVEGISDTIEHIERALGERERVDKSSVPVETFETLWRCLATHPASNTVQ